MSTTEKTVQNPMVDAITPFFAPFEHKDGQNEHLVGGKAGRQALMSSLFDDISLIPENLVFARKVFGSLGYNPIPYGTTFTSAGYNEFKKSFAEKVRPIIESFEADPNPDFGLEVETQCKEIVMQSEFSPELEGAFRQAFASYIAHLLPGDFTYLRSSAPSEDGFEASGSGKYDSIPSVTEVSKVLDVIKLCAASRFNSTALDYQVGMREREEEFRKPLLDLPFAVLIQRMINSKAAGTVMTTDTQSGNPDFISINLSYGLGESVVANLVNPDKFTVSKKRLLAGKYAIVDRNIGSKETTRQFKEGAHENIEVSETPLELQRVQCVPDAVVHQVAKMCLAWADIVGYDADIEVSLTHSSDQGWRVYFTQIRPVTAMKVDKTTLVTYTIPHGLNTAAKVISKHGEKVGVSKIVSAKVVEIKFHGLDEDALKVNFAKMFKQALRAAGVDFELGS
jgi:pyruvate,water dikinase